jgi:MoaA/NifB/PqqE/SkfB family radical SAM enzyme
MSIYWWRAFFVLSQDKNVLDLCSYASRVGFTGIEIFTNAQRLTREIAVAMKDAGVKVATSLYSVVPEVHDSITGKKGSFNKTLLAIEMLMALGIKVRVEVVAMSINQDTLEETMTFLQKLGVRSRNPDLIRPTGNGMGENLSPSDEYVKKYGFLTKPEFTVRKETFLSNRQFNSCLKGKLAVTDTGDVLPCVFARDEVLGNLLGQDLESIFNGEVASRIRGL